MVMSLGRRRIIDFRIENAKLLGFYESRFLTLHDV
jgi:hypothetical protein